MSSVDGARTLHAASDENFTNVCGPCNYSGNQNEASNFCDDCREFLCRSCTESHKGQKISRNHKLLSASHISRQAATTQRVSCSVLCDCSQNLEVTVYCEVHNDVTCQTCKSLKHRNCNTLSLNETGSSHTKATIESVEQRANRLKGETDEFLNDRTADLHKLDSMKEKCKKDIKILRKELTKVLDMLEDITKEVEKLESQERRDIERHISTCLTTKQMIEIDFKLHDDVKTISEKTSMFAADVKITNHLKEYERLLHDIAQETKSPMFRFKQNTELSDMLTKIKEFGTLAIDYIQTHQFKRHSLPDIKVESYFQVDVKSQEDKTTPSISGCGLMPDGQIVLCDDANAAVKLLNKSFRIEERIPLPCPPFDVAIISDKKAIISLPERKQLQYIELVPSLTTALVIQLDMQCWGVEVVGEEILTSCHCLYWLGKAAELRIFDLNGKLKRTIGVNQDGSYMFDYPYYLAVNGQSGKIYVSDVCTSTVTCLRPDGSVVYKHKYKGLTCTRGIYVDEEDNIVVCGGESHNLYAVNVRGKKICNLLTSEDGIKKPRSVAYRHTDGTLIVGCRDVNTLFVFKTT